MRRLVFLSSISALAVAGCGDDTCGPGDAPAFGLLASSADVTLTYGNFTSSQNHDCPDPDAPNVEPLTIEGTQQDASAFIVFCLPRPDKLMAGDLSLASDLKIININGDKDGCTYMFEGSRPVTGTVHAQGLCDNGADKSGWALSIDGAISLRRTCQTTTDTIAVTLQGVTAIKAK